MMNWIDQLKLNSVISKAYVCIIYVNIWHWEFDLNCMRLTVYLE